MHEIEMHKMSEKFFPCWRAAGKHLARQVDGGVSWLRAHPYPPFLEHLSFRLGNQLFFIRILDCENRIAGPGNMEGLFAVTEAAKGYACLLPMRKNLTDETWATELSGWGLLDAVSHKPINPVELISDTKIEMTDWEVHDMAVQVVHDYLENHKFQLMSWQGNPGVDPSIWFIGKSGRPEWVVVRSAKYPNKIADKPINISAIRNSCAKVGTIGHFASVSIVSVEQSFLSDHEPVAPLWRGHGMHVRFIGLDPL